MEIVSKASLKEHQEVLFELLQAFDAVCRKHQIKYMLFAGTALGAVRHQGFIPWDDDLDVVMLRPEYDRFMKIAEGELDLQKYFLQKEFSEHYPMFFSKLRKNNTTCFERFIPKDSMTHQGIYIDIFPCDNLSDNRILRKIQFYASKIVISKSLDRRGYRTNNIFKKVFMLLCRLIPMNFIRDFVQLKSAKTTAKVHTFFGASARYEKNVYPRCWLEKVMDMPFENSQFPVSIY